MRHLIAPFDFSVDELEKLLDLGKNISNHPENYANVCNKKILATLFYEPSTRTRLSFESAMLRMGGQVLGFSSADSSSAAKGESVADTMRMISGYADICVMRHPLEGAPMRASRFASIPIINAGDGGHQHPTQTLTDLLTILGRKNRLNNLRVGFCGDLKYGRTVHSLMLALSRYSNNTITLISPKELRVPSHCINDVRQAGTTCIECTSLEDAIGDLDILYMTRIQKERFTNPQQYEKLKNIYILTPEKLENAKADMAILHPLPRVNEIAMAVDSDSRAAYFEQAQNGVYARMALIITLLGLAPSGKLAEQSGKTNSEIIKTPCINRRCITTTETEIAPLYFEDTNKKMRCIYCEREFISQ